MLPARSPFDEERIYLLGINTTWGIGYLANLINRYIDQKLKYFTTIQARQKSIVNDSMAVFANYIPNISDTKDDANLIPDLSDMSGYIQSKVSEKFLLIQAKGEQMNMFPKIRQIDYVFASNYSLAKVRPALQEIDDIHYIFDLNETHLGKKVDYFAELMR